jgi:SAM-dependent methyltransferase
MSLADEYRRQRVWRDWETAFSALPPLEGRTVLDLGCAVGDLAAELVARGARVIGLDANDELLAAARERKIPKAEFRHVDLREPLDLGAGFAADGIWCSFTAAYFLDLPAALANWSRALRPGGWIALTEIDDLFGHEPVSPRARERFDTYVEDALAAGRYDFRMGRKLRGHLEQPGFSIRVERELADREFAFDGPALPEVIEAWRQRFDRMPLLEQACGKEFGAVRDDFLAALARTDHRSTARVCFVLASR